MTLAPDYSPWKRFWHWFWTGRHLGDPRFRDCQSPPRNLQRDERGRMFFFPEGSAVPMYVYDLRPALERARRAREELKRMGLVQDDGPPRPVVLAAVLLLTTAFALLVVPAFL